MNLDYQRQILLKYTSPTANKVFDDNKILYQMSKSLVKSENVIRWLIESNGNSENIEDQNIWFFLLLACAKWYFFFALCVSTKEISLVNAKVKYEP